MRGRRADREVTEIAVDVAGDAVEMVREMIEYMRERPAADALNGKELEAAASLFPRWSVNSGFSDGKAHKVYTRSLSDVQSYGSGDFRDFYLRFTDPEHFDGELLRIFKSWQGSGDIGTDMHFTISAEEVGPITYQDMLRIASAELYLQGCGYLIAPEPALT